MKLTFLGTKGYIEHATKNHRMHTSLLISYKNTKIMVDCGEDWLKKLKTIKCNYIVLTHAHPDHAFGLKEGSPCPVYATKDCWKDLEKYPIEKKCLMPTRKKIKLGSIFFEAFPVIHSVKCPAVGYKIQAGKVKIFYVPDVAWIKDMKKAFKGISVYIGDGATISRNMIRKSKDTGELFGHAMIRQQLTWCQKHKIPKMIITHCGKDIVEHQKEAKKTIQKFADERNVEVVIAHDKMELILK